MTKAPNELIDALKKAHSIALILHISPDGDTCGSAFALCRALLSLGKRVAIFCDDPVPRIYTDLPCAEAVQMALHADRFQADLAVAMDVGDRQRMGGCVKVFDAASNTAQVDHHPTNPLYAGVNWVRPSACATSVLALELIDALGTPLDAETARCIYVGVATDTGNFKHNNTNPEALQVAARCVEAGVQPSAIVRRVFDLRPVGQVRLIARALSSLELLHDGTVAFMRLTREDFIETGALPEHTEGIIDFAINTEGVLMASLLSEQEDRIKCSLRAVEPYDAGRVAVSFGGGGHQLASGCVFHDTLEQARDKIVGAMREAINRQA